MYEGGNVRFDISSWLFIVPLSTLVLVTSGKAANVGESINFTCQTNYCDLPANITWYKGNTSISGTTHVTSTLNTNSESQVRTTSELWFSSVAPEDNCREMYCTASNMEGETVESRRFKLNVTCKQCLKPVYIFLFLSLLFSLRITLLTEKTKQLWKSIRNI